MAKPYPSSLTSYDFYKSLAIVLMIIDHIGAYFYPETDMFRAIGRGCLPIWIGLIGYAETREVSARLMIGALVLFVTNLVVGEDVLPLSILVSFMLIRLFLDRTASIMLYKNSLWLWGGVVVLAMLWWPTRQYVCEYGTVGLLLALYGYALRHREKLSDKTLEHIMLASLVFLILSQSLVFEFSPVEFLVMALSCFIGFALMYFFEPRTYADLIGKVPKIAVFLLKMGGRRTLEIYVVHLVVFRVLALLLETKDYAWFQWHIF